MSHVDDYVVVIALGVVGVDIVVAGIVYVSAAMDVRIVVDAGIFGLLLYSSAFVSVSLFLSSSLSHTHGCTIDVVVGIGIVLNGVVDLALVMRLLSDSSSVCFSFFKNLFAIRHQFPKQFLLSRGE